MSHPRVQKVLKAAAKGGKITGFSVLGLLATVGALAIVIVGADLLDERANPPSPDDDF